MALLATDRYSEASTIFFLYTKMSKKIIIKNKFIYVDIIQYYRLQSPQQQKHVIDWLVVYDRLDIKCMYSNNNWQ